VDGSGRRAWGRKIRITNMNTGKSIICEQWDVGPGRAARARGVCVDLTPAAFLALDGQLKDGRMAVRVEVL
jgi:rare lipoprotein A (peptidoglycan hydrolase)